MLGKEHKSIVDILRWRAEHQANRLAYRFLTDGENEEELLTYAELDQRARSVASLLNVSTKPGDRVMLIFPPGLEFISAYIGCLYAGVIAVPVYPPHHARLDRSIPFLLRIVSDAAPAVALLNSALFEIVSTRGDFLAQCNNLQWLVIDSRPAHAELWNPSKITGDDIAFLQYTSGSTTEPRGVMVSHANLMHNLGLIEKHFGQSAESHAVIWLPPYHDMGLVGGVLQPLYSGYPSTLMPHMMFLQKPFRWLNAISRFKATTSGGPDFAYDLCVRKIKPEQKEMLDLSDWKVAFNGAEQVREKTMKQFTECFSPCGFQYRSFLPCYGLAEATLMVSGGPPGRVPEIRNLLRSDLEINCVTLADEDDDKAMAVVGCGKIEDEQDVLIVHPVSLVPCKQNQIGEVWVHGASVARGYWNKEAETAFSFDARISASDPRRFLRTGDLGFVMDGELFITGRIKDLIILDGANHYPHDIERTVEASHPVLQPSCSAAFSVERNGTEQLIILTEVKLKPGIISSELIGAIKKAVAEQHQVHVGDIKLIDPGGIPRTTSGKIKRFLCRTQYQNGILKESTPLI